jgi:hypothetical protein
LQLLFFNVAFCYVPVKILVELMQVNDCRIPYPVGGVGHRHAVNNPRQLDQLILEELALFATATISNNLKLPWIDEPVKPARRCCRQRYRGLKFIRLVSLAGAAKGGGVDLLFGLIVCCVHGFSPFVVVYISSEPPHEVTGMGERA